MSRASQRQFKIALYMDRAQRKAFDAIEKEASSIHTAVLREAAPAFEESSLIPPRESVIKAVMEWRRETMANGMMTDFSAESVARESHDRWILKNDGKIDRGRRYTPRVEVPVDDVVFSVSERLVRIPYLGLVKHASNQKIISDPGVASIGNKATLGSMIRRVFIGSQNSTFFILMDCTEPGEDRMRALRKRPKKLPDILE